MAMYQEADPGARLSRAYIIAPHWGGAFLLLGGLILLFVGITATLVLGVSAGSDRVFAVEALISGVAADLTLRRVARRELVLGPKLGIPFLYIWPVMCLYVFIATPFE